MPGCCLYEFGGLKRFGFVDPRTQPDPKKKKKTLTHHTKLVFDFLSQPAIPESPDQLLRSQIY